MLPLRCCEQTLGAVNRVMGLVALFLLLTGCSFDFPFVIRVRQGPCGSMRVVPKEGTRSERGVPLADTEVKVWFVNNPSQEADVTGHTNNDGVFGPEQDSDMIRRRSKNDVYIECRKEGYRPVEGTVPFWSAARKVVLVTMRKVGDAGDKASADE